MLATVVTINNPFNPSKDMMVRRVDRKKSIAKLAPKTQLPFICLYNGVPLLRENNGWDIKISNGDIITFKLIPQGGGGSNPLKMILMIAIAIAAPYIAGALAPTLGIVSEIGMTVLGAAIGFVGNVLVNALLPPPKIGSSKNSQSMAAASPTYNLQAQGNRARIGEAIPVLYGQHLIFPDYAAEPYTEYEGNNQYLYQLFCVGQGAYTISDIKIEDTAVTNFPEITYEIVNPGGKVTMFPSNVVTATEVAGQELLTNVAVGPFVINPSSTKATFIAVDVVCPRGLYYANDDGGLNSVAVVFKIEARLINDAGTPIGSFVTLGTETIRGATATAQRRSYKYAVTEGRYDIKLTRTDAKQTDTRYGHEVHWESVRGYLPSSEDYGQITLLAMRMKSSDSLSSQTARRINCIAYRKLPIWNGTVWSAPTPTRSIAWALADICRSSYGGKLPNSRVDVASLLALDAIWAARGDTFDGVFDQKQVMWEVLELTARAGRAKRFMQGGVVHFVRDGAATVPVALFNMRNIVRNTLRVEYLIPNNETADSVTVEYFDATKQKPLEVEASLPESIAENPAIVSLFGVTSRQKAYAEGMYIAACNRYRRQVISFSTDMEGFIPTFGDLIAISHDRMQRNVSGDVRAYNTTTNVLTLSEPVTFTAGTHYIAFKRRDGSYSGPWVVTTGVDNKHIITTLDIDFTPDVGADMERTSFSFGKGEEFRKLARVMAVRPKSINRVEIMCVNEDAAVHTADTGSAPPPSIYWNLPAKITRPVIQGLSVTLSGTASNPRLAVDWLPAAGAARYAVESSYDTGDTWQRVAEVSVSNASIPAGRGSVIVRVAGIGLSQGDWAQWAGDPYAVPPADVSSFLVNVQPDGTRQFNMYMSGGQPPDFMGYEIRYKTGSGPYVWDDLVPIQEGLVPTNPWESNQLDAGQYTFAVKAVDTSGVYSLNANFLLADLADQRLAGVIFSLLPRTYGWPGTKTGFIVETDTGDLLASDTALWSGLTTWTAWNQWPTIPTSPASYTHTTIDLGAIVPFIPLIGVIASGGTVLIQESHSNDNVTYSSYATVSGLITARYIKIKVTVTGSLPRIKSIDIKLSGDNITEEVNDLATSTLTGSNRIGVGDVRIPHSKTFATITQLQVSLQNVGPGWSFEIVDKNTTFGPRIKIYNASNTLADATIDAFFRGF